MRRAATIVCILSLSASQSVAQSLEETARQAASLGYISAAARTPIDRSAVDAWRNEHRSDIAAVQIKVRTIHDGAERPGCIGQDKITCAASIASVVPVTDDYRFSSLFPDQRLDVNGHDLNGRRFQLFAFDIYAQPGAKRLIFDLVPGRNGQISSVTAFLPADPMFARTPGEYAKTKLFEAVTAVLPSSCLDLADMSVAQWFENKVKPAAKFEPMKFDHTVSSVDMSRERKAKAKLCGRSLEFHSIQGVSPDLVSIDRNPNGTFGGMQIVVR